MIRQIHWLIVISFSFFLQSTGLFSQQKQFVGGVLLNFNGIEFKGSESRFWNSPGSSEEIQGTLGSSAGIFVKREITKSTYAVIEFRYIRKGSIYGFTGQYGTPSYETLHLNYIEVPILFGYKTKIGRRFFYFESGFAYAKLISTNINANDLINRIGTPDADAFKHSDISWIGEFKFPLVMKWKKHFLFGLRVSRSILAIHEYYKIYNFDYGVELNYAFN